MKQIFVFLLSGSLCFAAPASTQEESKRLPRRELEQAFPEAERFEILANPERAVPFFVARSRKGVLGACSYYDLADERPDGKETHTFLACANPNGKITGLFPVKVSRKALSKPLFLKQFRGIWPENLGKIVFPRGVTGAFAAKFREELVKTVKAIDAVLPP